MQTFLLSLLLVSVAIFTTLNRRRTREAHPRTPPGPLPLPVIGNIFSFPIKQRGAKLHEMSKKYGKHRSLQWHSHSLAYSTFDQGDVMYFNVLGKKTVVLSSEVAARDLLEKRSAIYSDRPRITSIDM